MYSYLLPIKEKYATFPFLLFHTMAVVLWGFLNVWYYPVLQDHFLYFWIFPSFFAAVFYPKRVYMITLFQSLLLGTIVVTQYPPTFFNSMLTLSGVFVMLLLLFEFIFRMERKREKESALHQKEISIYRNALLQADLIPYERDYLSNQFTFVGDNLEKITGYTKEEWTPEYWDYISTVQKILGEGSGLSAQDAVRKARTGYIRNWIAECVLNLKDGRQKWMLNSSIEIKNHLNISERSIGFLQDITESKRAEKILSCENIVLEKINKGESLSEIALTLINKYEETFPQAFCTLLSFDKTTQTLHPIASPSLPDELNQLLDGFNIGPNMGSCGTAVYRKETVIVSDTLQDPLWENLRWIAEKFRLRACWSMPILSKENEVYGTFAVYYTKPRSPWKEELRFLNHWVRLAALAFESTLSAQKLQENEKWFRALIENTYDVIYVFNGDGTLRYASPSSERILGYTAKEYEGKHYSYFVHPDDVSNINAAFQKMALRTESDPEYVQVRVRHKDQHWMYVEIVGRNRLDDPAVNGFILNVRDITDRQLAEETLRRQDEQMWRTQKIESLGRLTRGISHEFNNLLTIIYGNCEIIKKSEDIPGSIQDRIDEIYDATKRASRLTQHLRSFTREQSDSIETFDLNELIRSSLYMINPILDNMVLVELNLPTTPINVCVGKNHIQQILINLALNARDAMPNGGTFTVQTEVLQINNHPILSDGDYVKMSISDTGCGMDKDTIEKIYEPFFTTKHSEGNRGLGLSTVYGIVEQYKGLVHCESHLNVGTTFSIYLSIIPSSLPKHFHP